MRCCAFALAAALHGATAYMKDTVISAPMRPPALCANGCAAWANISASHNTAPQPAVDALWASAAAQRAAGAACALPANLGVPQGAACYCAGAADAPTRAWGYCSEPDVPYPQQVNLQHGASGAELQVAWVTSDRGLPLARPPIVEVCGAGGGACVNASGAATRAPEPQLPSRVLTYAFVPRPPALTVPGAILTYRALPGTSPAAWSEVFTLAIPKAGAAQSLAVFGDQGVYPYSSLGNLLDDLGAGAISAVLHLGDLAYNMAMENGTRGDGYMYALEPLLSRIPMVYTIGVR